MDDLEFFQLQFNQLGAKQVLNERLQKCHIPTHYTVTQPTPGGSFVAVAKTTCHGLEVTAKGYDNSKKSATERASVALVTRLRRELDLPPVTLKEHVTVEAAFGALSLDKSVSASKDLFQSLLQTKVPLRLDAYSRPGILLVRTPDSTHSVSSYSDFNSILELYK